MTTRAWCFAAEDHDSGSVRQRQLGSVDCSSLSPTHELVALFEEKLSRGRNWDYSRLYPQSESCAQQRARFSHGDQLPLKSQVRLRNRLSAERKNTDRSTRFSSGLRIACPVAKGVFFSGAKSSVPVFRNQGDSWCIPPELQSTNDFSPNMAHSPLTEQESHTHSPDRAPLEAIMCSERKCYSSHSEFVSGGCVTPLHDQSGSPANIKNIENSSPKNITSPGHINSMETSSRSSKSRRAKLFKFSLCGSGKSKHSSEVHLNCPYSPIANTERTLGTERTFESDADDSMNSSDNQGSLDGVEPIEAPTAQTMPSNEGSQVYVTPPRKPQRATVITPVGYTPENLSGVQQQISSSSVYTPHHARRGSYRSFVSLRNSMARERAALAPGSQGKDPGQFASRSLDLRLRSRLSGMHEAAALADDCCDGGVSYFQSDVPFRESPNRQSFRRHSSLIAGSANLVPTGATLDEETFQRLMDELEDVKALVGSLVHTLQLQTSASVDSPLEEVLRGEILSKFNYFDLNDSPRSPLLFQDTATQTEPCDPISFQSDYRL